MLRSFIIALFAISCSQVGQEPEIKAAHRGQTAPVPKPPEIVFDTTFTPGSGVGLWKMEVTEAIDALVALPDPDKTDAGFRAAFKVTKASTDVYLAHEIGDVREWTADGIPEETYPEAAEPAPTKDSAALLEATSQHYAAGLAYLTLKDKASATRCMKALVKKGEWNAAAVLAYELGDTATRDKALDTLHGDSQDDRVRSVIERAIDAKKMDTAAELAKRYGWTLDDPEFEDALVATGNAKAIARIVDVKVEKWLAYVNKQSDEVNPNDGYILANCVTGVTNYLGYSSDAWSGSQPISEIVKLSRIDKPAALALARKLLTNRHTNVVSIGEEDYSGEGGTYSNRVSGTVEFYQFVKSDPELKRLYLRQVSGWATDSVKERSLTQDEREGIGGWQSSALEDSCNIGVPSNALLALVKKSGDADLIRVWQNNIVLFERVETIDYESKQLVRADLPFQRYLLGMPEGDPGQADPYVYGEVSNADLERMWMEFKLPVIADEGGPRYKTTDEQQAALKIIRDLSYSNPEEAGKTTRYLILSGYRGAELDGWVNGYRLSDIELGVAYALIDAGRPQAARKIVVAKIAEEVERRRAAIEEGGNNLIALVGQPYKAATDNAYAAEAVAKWRLKNPLVDPDTEEEAAVLVATVLPALKAKAPATFETFIVSEARSNRRGAYDAELSARNAAGDLAGVQRLTDLLSHKDPVASR